MEKNTIYLLFCCLLMIVCGVDGRNKLVVKKEAAFWCIAKLKADPEKLQAFVDYICELANCESIKPGGACYDPPLIPSHANYVLDLVYKRTSVCDPDIANIVFIDPSYGTCHYP